MSELFNLLNLLIGLALGIIIGGLAVKLSNNEVKENEGSRIKRKNKEI